MTGKKKEKRKQDLPEQFDYIEKARQLMLQWTKTNNINLFRIEYIVPFVLTDKSLDVWLFFDTEKISTQYQTDGTIQKAKTKFLDILVELDYPTDNLKGVMFYVDTDENVQKNYEGNYFYRLR